MLEEQKKQFHKSYDEILIDISKAKLDDKSIFSTYFEKYFQSLENNSVIEISVDNIKKDSLFNLIQDDMWQRLSDSYRRGFFQGAMTIKKQAGSYLWLTTNPGMIRVR